MIKTIRKWVMTSPAVGWYYKAQQYVDIAWAEFSWFSDSLVEMMAIIYLLDKMGITIGGIDIGIILASAFVGCFFIGIFFKKIGTYDRSVYVETEIDPVSKEMLQAARLIIKHYENELDRNRRTII